ncbi:hypothetical protein D3C81_948260 [compost metagenome]
MQSGDFRQFQPRAPRCGGQQRGKTSEQGVQRVTRTVIGCPGHARPELVDGMEARQCLKEVVVQAQHQRVVRAHLRILEHRCAAQAFQLCALAGQAQVQRAKAGGGLAALQRGADEAGEGGDVLLPGGQQHRCHALRKQQAAHHAGTRNADRDLAQADHDVVEDGVRVGDRRHRRNAGGIARQHEAVRLVVAEICRAAHAQADPQGQAQQEQHALLRERKEQQQCGHAAYQHADGAVEAPRQHHAALLVHHQDHHRHHCRARRGQFQPHRQPRCHQHGNDGLGRMEQAATIRLPPGAGRAGQPCAGSGDGIGDGIGCCGHGRKRGKRAGAVRSGCAVQGCAVNRRRMDTVA